MLTLRLSRRRARGFSLAEIVVAMTLLGILGAAFTRIMVSQGRFADQQNALRSARNVSRQGLNLLVSEARMVQDSGGIDSAATDGKAIRLVVPYRYGLNCGVGASGKNVLSMLPVDSVMVAQAVYAGYAYRSGAGRYTTVYPAAPLGADAPVTSGTPTQCTTTAGFKTLTLGGRAGQILEVSPSQTTTSFPIGQQIFFFQRVTYTFKASTAFPGKQGLYRSVLGGVEDELAAPFDTSARFKYWTAAATASVASPPALALIRGIDVVFVSKSGYTPMGKSAPIQNTVIASIFFKNVRNY